MNPPDNSPETAPAALQAAEWLIKRDRGLTATEQDDFFQWLAADPHHGECFARQQRTWKDFNRLAQWRPEHSAEPNPDLLARSDGSARRWLAWTLPLAAAAGLIVSLLVNRSPEAAPSAPMEVVAHVYERRVLADGSVIDLKAGSQVEVAYQPAERRVRLVHGEASFTVAKNPERPFIVRAGGIDVRAVGTAFNVRLDAKSVEVLVTEGRVRVDDVARGGSVLAVATPGEVPVLSARQRVVVNVAPIAPVAAAPVSAGEVEQLLAWKPVLFDFDSQPLAEVLAQFNRRNQLKLVLADPGLADLPIVASFRSDNVEGFVRLLQMTAGVRTERSGDTITLSAEP